METDARQARQRSHERRRIRRQVGDEVSGEARRVPVEGVPAGEQPLRRRDPRRNAARDVPGAHRSRGEDESLGERRPRERDSAASSRTAGPRHCMEPRQRARAPGRGPRPRASARCAGRSQAISSTDRSGMRIADLVAVDSRPRGTARRPGEPACHVAARPASRIERVVASRRRSSRSPSDVRLITNRSRPRSIIENRRARPAVGREVVLRGARPGRAPREATRTGSAARAASARSRDVVRSVRARRPCSATTEPGQFRVRTTTSGSVGDAFSSTWISPAGM